jgi:DNA-directed RNA polymerase subunit M/transcription elongation factor TFIIS
MAREGVTEVYLCNTCGQRYSDDLQTKVITASEQSNAASANVGEQSVLGKKSVEGITMKKEANIDEEKEEVKKSDSCPKCGANMVDGKCEKCNYAKSEDEEKIEEKGVESTNAPGATGDQNAEIKPGALSAAPVTVQAPSPVTQGIVGTDNQPVLGKMYLPKQVQEYIVKQVAEQTKVAVAKAMKAVETSRAGNFESVGAETLTKTAPEVATTASFKEMYKAAKGI